MNGGAHSVVFFCWEAEDDLNHILWRCEFARFVGVASSRLSVLSLPVMGY